MNIPAEFDEIRPYTPEELPAVFDELLADPQFLPIALSFFPGVSREQLAARLHQCTTNLEVQKRVFYPLVEQLVMRACTSVDLDTQGLPVSNYTFVSNHRDIVLDSALLAMLLIDAGFGTTCEIAIGDNLLAAPWIKDLVRLNKSFIVERSAGLREMLASSKRMADYMHYVIARKHDNIWIAQREGRAKDSDDRTQPSVLKMMAMGGDGSAIDRLRQLHIVPLAISYEYDPCDYLKAMEFQLRRDVPGWKKTKADDVMSMQTGIMGRKGRIHYHCSTCIDAFLDTLDPAMPKGELFDTVARHIDRAIHSNYRLYAGNYVAADTLWPGEGYGEHFTEAERRVFEDYVGGQLARIELEGKDEPFLRECILRMYANPVRNNRAALAATV